MWQLQEAKAKFSEVVRCARENGPQEVSVHGIPEVIVISIEDYQKLTQNDVSFYEFFSNSPLNEISEELDEIVQNRQSFDRDTGDLT